MFVNRFNSPSSRTVSPTEYQHFFDSGNNPFVESEMAPNKSEDKGSVKMSNLDEPSSAEKKKEDIIIQKSFGVISKAMFGEIVGDSNELDLSRNKECQINGKIDGGEKDEGDLKEIVESFFFSYGNSSGSEDLSKEEETFNSCNGNVIDTRSNSCDNINSRLAKLNEELSKTNLVEVGLSCNLNEGNICSNENVNNPNSCSEAQETCSDATSEAKCDENCLDHFNSYNYWKVSPELPLDPLIVDGEHSTKEDASNVSEENLVVSIFLK